MKLDRRQFLKGALGLGAAAIILPPTLEENVELGRRIWALGGIPQEGALLYDPRTINFRYLAYADAVLERMCAITIQEYGHLVKVPSTRELEAVVYPYGGTADRPIPSYSTDNTGRW